MRGEGGRLIESFVAAGWLTNYQKCSWDLPKGVTHSWRPYYWQWLCWTGKCHLLAAQATCVRLTDGACCVTEYLQGHISC